MITLPEGVTLKILKERYDVADRQYTRPMKKAKLLDAADRGKLWEASGIKFPKYQILTDSNHVAYIKNNLLSSLYSVGKVPSLEMTSKEDKDVIAGLNIALDRVWSKSEVGYHQMLAGERAALLNLGLTHVGWDSNKQSGKGDTWFKGDIKLKNINPLKFRRDPFADNIETASFACYWDVFHKSILESDSRYKEEFKSYLDSQKTKSGQKYTQDIYTDTRGENAQQKDYYKIFISWIRVEGKIVEVHSINYDHVLHMIDNLLPANEIPIAELYCNIPAGDIIGTSEPSKIFSNSLAINIMNSILFTSEYKNQRPPRFVNSQSGLNINAFKKYGNEADYTFIVNGDASRAVHYHQFPQASPQLPSLMNMAANDIKNLSGVDDRYTGRDTGSIITTGGTEAMLDQVTIIDQPKINNYNKYSIRLSKLIMSNLIEFSEKRKYFVQDKTIEVAFPDIDGDTLFDYAVDISPELPRNRARLAQMATVLMEKQLQYRQSGLEVDWITPEEWLMFQDIPHKEFMSERMGIQRNKDFVEQVAQVVFQYSELTQQGMDPEEALMATAQTLQESNAPDAALGHLAPSVDNGMPM